MWVACVIVVAFFNAIMDSVENEHFFDTKFRDKKKTFWYKRVSWNMATRIGGYKLDAWHLSKTLMIVFFSLAVVLYQSYFGFYDLLIAGAAWNISFNIFYWWFKK